MDETAHLIEMLDKSRALMRELVNETTEKTPVYPPWTMKHLLAHIAGWDDASAASLRALVEGREPATPAIRGIDHYNAESVATREHLPYDRIVHEWELAREQFKAAIRAVPAGKLNAPLLLPWSRTGSAAGLVHIMIEHEEEHAAEIRQMRAGADTQ